MNARRNPPMPALQMRGTTLGEESAHVERLIAANQELIAECEREVERGNDLARKLNAAEGELGRLLEVNGDLMTESRQLHALVRAAKAVVERWREIGPSTPTEKGLRTRLDALARAHEDGGQDR